MRTDELINQLAADSVPLRDPREGLLIALAGGGLAALLGLMLVRGMPLQAVALTGVGPLALKLGYALAAMILSAMALVAAGRPGQPVAGRMMLIALPLATLLLAMLMSGGGEPTRDRPELMFNVLSLNCVASVGAASVPGLAGIFWACHRMAPTRPILAGFLAGLVAGAAAATAYALFCPETSAAFLAASYTTAMLLPALAGAAIGSRLLRW